MCHSVRLYNIRKITYNPKHKTTTRQQQQEQQKPNATTTTTTTARGEYNTLTSHYLNLTGLIKDFAVFTQTDIFLRK